MEASRLPGAKTAGGASKLGAALLGVAVAVAVRAALEPLADTSHTAITFFLFLAAAALVAARLGLASALLTLLLGGLAAWFVFVPPRHTFAATDLVALSGLAVYFVTGTGISYLAAAYRTATLNAATAREMTVRVDELERALAARPAESGQATLEERFRTPADQMKDAAIFLLDAQGRAASWNKGVRRLLGYDKAEFLQRAAADLYPPDDRAAEVPERELAAATEQGRASQERWLLRKDGTRFWASTSIASVHGQHGALVGFACTLRDLSGLRQVQEELRRHREALELAHDAAGLGAWQHDLDTGEARWDARARELFGLASDAAVTTTTWLETLHPADRERVEQAWGRALHDRRPFSAEYRVVWPDGSVHWLASMGRVTVSATSAEGHQFSGVLLDITERKETEERLQEVLRLEAVGRLAGGIAHDLNNMLAVILGFSDLLAQSLERDDARRRDVGQIAQAANRSASLTRQLLAFARRELIQPKRLDVGVVLRRIEGMLRSVLGPNIELIFRLAPDAGVIYADPGQVEQILMNLVLNARDAMPQGGRVTVETASMVLRGPATALRSSAELPAIGRYLMVSVRDTGHGMDVPTLQRIWEPFFTTKPVGQGTGLGLSAVYGAVKQSGGFVWADSEPGRGTVIGVYWPELLLAPDSEDSALAPAAQRGSETVLIVDDEPLLRALAARTLSNAGYRCFEAADADEALRAIDEEPHLDLVVTDVLMPGMSGGRLGERLALLRPALPVLYMSGFTDEDVVRRGLLGAGRPFLQKPFSPGDLARMVREVLNAAAAERG